MIFLIVNWPNFVHLLVDSGFLPPPYSFPLKFLWSTPVRPPHRMDAPDRHDRLVRPSVRPSVRLLDGAWHTLRGLFKPYCTLYVEKRGILGPGSSYRHVFRFCLGLSELSGRQNRNSTLVCTFDFKVVRNFHHSCSMYSLYFFTRHRVVLTLHIWPYTLFAASGIMDKYTE